MTIRGVTVVLLSLSGCFSVPDDTVVEHLRIKSFTETTLCQEMKVELLAETVARGGCDAVDPATSVVVDPVVIDGIEQGIGESSFATRGTTPTPDCGGCPTRQYLVLVSSASEDASTEKRIVPAQSLLDALAPLAPP